MEQVQVSPTFYNDMLKVSRPVRPFNDLPSNLITISRGYLSDDGRIVCRRELTLSEIDVRSLIGALYSVLESPRKTVFLLLHPSEDQPSPRPAVGEITVITQSA